MVFGPGLNSRPQRSLPFVHAAAARYEHMVFRVTGDFLLVFGQTLVHLLAPTPAGPPPTSTTSASMQIFISLDGSTMVFDC